MIDDHSCKEKEKRKLKTIISEESMKTSLFLTIASTAAAALSARTTAAAEQSARSHSHALVFSPAAPNADCHGFSAEDKCLAAHCYWCKSAAVPSACYSEDEADQLPPAVFQCDKQARVLSWDLKKASAP